MSRKLRPGVVLVLLCLVVIALGGHAQDKIPVPRAIRQARASLHLQNDVLDLYFTERNSDTWLFQYSPGEWGESCYHEHFAIWTPQGIRESEAFSVTQAFTVPSGGSSTCIVTSAPFEVIRTIEVDPGDVDFFDIIYLIKNTGSATRSDVRFFQAIDFDIPDTWDCTDDYGQYDSGDRKTWIVDYEFFRDTVTATPLPDQHGLDHWSIEIWDDWDDGILNERSWYGPGDPGLALRFNLGNMQPGQQKEVRIRVRFDVAAAADLQVDNVEINQAFQDKDVENPDAVPLVAGKPTVVRALVDIGSVDGPVPNVTGELHILKDGTEIAGSPFSPMPGTISAPKNPDRQEINDTLNFYIGELEDGEHEAFIVLDPEDDVFEANEENNRYPKAGVLEFAVREQEEIHILYYRLRQDNLWADLDRVRVGPAFMRAVYPTDAVRYTSGGDRVQNWGGDVDFSPWTNIGLLHFWMLKAGYNLWNEPDAGAVVCWLPEGAMDSFPCPIPGNPNRRCVWYGVTNPNLNSAFVYDDEDKFQATLAHEVGHDYGLNLNDEEYIVSPNLRIGEGGFDVSSVEVIPETHYNFMNNKDTDVTWVSSETYVHLYSSIGEARSSLHRQHQEYLVVSGTVDRLCNVDFHPFYRLSGIVEPSDFAGGSCTLQFLDEGGSVLATYEFEPDYRILGMEEESDVAVFGFVVPYPGLTAQITLECMCDAGARAGAQVYVSASSPEVAVVFPNGGEALSGVVNVDWTGDDPDGDTLSYSIFYSTEEGLWIPLAEGISQTSYEWDTGAIAGGWQCRIKVLATDGVNTSQDESDAAFTIQRKDPTAFILAPGDGCFVREGDVLALVGSGFDLEDGELTGQSLGWVSDLDGQLGTGEALYITTLSEGQHAITLTVTDSDGGVDTDTVVVTVVRDTAAPPPPTGLQTNMIGSLLQLTWTPSVADDVGGYILHLGEAPGDYYLVRDIGNVTQWETDDLAVGRTYYLALSAYDRVRNEGVLSDEVVATYAPECTVESTTTGTTGWHMLSLPGELCDPCTWTNGEICGDLVCALSDDLNPCYIFHYDPGVGGYVMAPPAEAICYHAGMGFWVRTYEDNVTIDAEVQVPTEAVEVPLQDGWNQIGNLFPFSVSTGDLRVRCGETELSLLEAQAQGWISAHLFGYDTASGGYVMLTPPNDCLEAWHGYWLRVYREGCELLIPPEECLAAPPTSAMSVEELQARGIELPPPPPNDLMNLDVKEVLAGLTVRNVPNPIRSEHTTTFKVEGKAASLVQAIRVDIYDLSGQQVFTQEIAAKELAWHTVNKAGELLANGVYLYQVWVKIAGQWYPTGVHKLAVCR